MTRNPPKQREIHYLAHAYPTEDEAGKHYQVALPKWRAAKNRNLSLLRFLYGKTDRYVCAILAWDGLPIEEDLALTGGEKTAIDHATLAVLFERWWNQRHQGEHYVRHDPGEIVEVYEGGIAFILDLDSADE